MILLFLRSYILTSTNYNPQNCPRPFDSYQHGQMHLSTSNDFKSKDELKYKILLNNSSFLENNDNSSTESAIKSTNLNLLDFLYKEMNCRLANSDDYISQNNAQLVSSLNSCDSVLSENRNKPKFNIHEHLVNVLTNFTKGNYIVFEIQQLANIFLNGTYNCILMQHKSCFIVKETKMFATLYKTRTIFHFFFLPNPDNPVYNKVLVPKVNHEQLCKIIFRYLCGPVLTNPFKTKFYQDIADEICFSFGDVFQMINFTILIKWTTRNFRGMRNKNKMGYNVETFLRNSKFDNINFMESLKYTILDFKSFNHNYEKNIRNIFYFMGKTMFDCFYNARNSGEHGNKYISTFSKNIFISYCFFIKHALK